MKFSDLMLVASRQIVRTRRRYRAPVIGTILGIAALIAVITLGDVAERAIGSSVAILGSATFVKATYSLDSLDYPSELGGFTEQDIKTIRNIPGVKVVAPVVYSWWPIILRFDVFYKGMEFRDVYIMGVDQSFFRLVSYKLPETDGRLFTDADNTRCESVCIVGRSVKEFFFARRNDAANAEGHVGGEMAGADSEDPTGTRGAHGNGFQLNLTATDAPRGGTPNPQAGSESSCRVTSDNGRQDIPTSLFQPPYLWLAPEGLRNRMNRLLYPITGYSIGGQGSEDVGRFLSRLAPLEFPDTFPSTCRNGWDNVVRFCTDALREHTGISTKKGGKRRSA